MYGSDFFFPPPVVEQHQYDNLNFSTKSSPDHYEPFPNVTDCPDRFHRSSLHDQSCQVPSDTEQDNEIEIDHCSQKNLNENRSSKRSSPIYSSPRSSPKICRPPEARNLLAPYHFRRQSSLSSSVALHNRSRSAPSASFSSISTRSSRDHHLPSTEKAIPLPITLCPLETVTTEPSIVRETSSSSLSTRSTAALLRSITSSIHAMRKRLKDIRRLSEVGKSYRC